METLLNLAWLVISAALLLIGLVHATRSARNRSRVIAAIAMICLICLLFPVISMTDDLNSGSLAFLEPGKGKRILPSAQLIAVVFSWLNLEFSAKGICIAACRKPEVFLPQHEPLPFNLSRRPPPAVS